MQINNGIASETFTLQSRDVDRYSTCNADTYFHYMQDAAGLHATLMGISINDLRERGRTWMVNRTKMKIHSLATWPSEVRIETWPQAPQKFYCPRGCRGYIGETLLFESMTRWLIIDLNKGRIAKPESENFERFDISGRNEPLDMDSRLSFDAENCEEVTETALTIRYKDTDTNGHVNNVSFVQWMLEALPFFFLDEYTATEIDITYLKEAFDSDKLICQTGFMPKEDGYTLQHQIAKQEEGELIPLCVAQSTWTNRNLSE